MGKIRFIHWLLAAAVAMVAVGLDGNTGAQAAPVTVKQPQPLTRLVSRDGFLYDGYGRVVLLRGANVPAHIYKPMKFGSEDLDALQKFGFNFIRLGISWDKAEPMEGQVDLAYIRSIVEFARMAGERGMYVLPEVHKYGWCQAGSDWPGWACVAPVKDGSDAAGMMKNARYFWDHPELQEKLINFWRLLIQEFRGLDNVMGYNPLNEPLDLSMLVPGVFDKKLFAFYEKWIVAARELDPDRAAVLEPGTANMIIPFKPQPFPYDNLVWAPHPYYVHGDGMVLKESDRRLTKKYARIAREARAMHATLIVGEYGGDPETKFSRDWLTKSLELQDQYFAGAAIWVYDPSNTGWAITDSDREPKPFFARALNRPYPRYTAGKPGQLEYSVQDRVFSFSYAPDPSISVPTEIYLALEPARGTIEVSNGVWSYDQNTSTMLIRPNAPGAEVVIEVRG